MRNREYLQRQKQTISVAIPVFIELVDEPITRSYLIDDQIVQESASKRFVAQARV